MVDKFINGREFLMAVPDWVFFGLWLGVLIGFEDVGEGVLVGGGIWDMEVDGKGANLVVWIIQNVMAW